MIELELATMVQICDELRRRYGPGYMVAVIDADCHLQVFTNSRVNAAAFIEQIRETVSDPGGFRPIDIGADDPK